MLKRLYQPHKLTSRFLLELQVPLQGRRRGGHRRAGRGWYPSDSVGFPSEVGEEDGGRCKRLVF